MSPRSTCWTKEGFLPGDEVHIDAQRGSRAALPPRLKMLRMNYTECGSEQFRVAPARSSIPTVVSPLPYSGPCFIEPSTSSE